MPKSGPEISQPALGALAKDRRLLDGAARPGAESFHSGGHASSLQATSAQLRPQASARLALPSLWQDVGVPLNLL